MGVDLSKSDPATDPLIGRTLDGRYEVLGRLGEGGVGVVYRGRQAHLGRFVAIKVLHQDAAGIPEWRRRFEREAKALSALAHPNVVPVTDFGIDAGVPFLVMELLHGKTLGELIKEAPGPLPLGRTVDIVRQTLRGLAFAHGKGIVHRDLKPANVFLQELPDQADHVRLLDFGMAKFLEGSASRTVPENLTRAGVVFGTPAYMSPEQVKAGSVDARSDVYAAGILLFELVAGRRPYVADTYEGYMGAHLMQPVPSLTKFRPKLGAARLLQSVIDRAMAKKPEERYADAGAMLTGLEAVIARRRVAAAIARSAGARGKASPEAPKKAAPDAPEKAALEAPKKAAPDAPEKAAPDAPKKATPDAPEKAAPDARGAAASGSRWGRRAIVLGLLTAAIAAVGAYLVHDGATPVETPAQPAKPRSKPSPPSALPAPQPPKPAPPTKPSPNEGPSAQPAQSAEPVPSAEPAPPEQPQSEGKPRPRARNPWREPAPRALRLIRDRVNRGAQVTQKALIPAYDYAHKNPGDPRPWLLLGHAYAQHDWLSDSVERYVRAYRVDATSRGDPQMLADLLKAAAHPAAARAAARAVRDIYGAEAIPALDRAMKSQSRAGDREASARLAKLRESLPK